MQVDWLIKESYGRKLLAQLAFNNECQPLFKTKSVKDIVDNFWNISRKYFVWNYFMCFFALNFLPLLIISFLI